MYVVMTKVKLRDGTHAQCAELFRDTNPALVKSEPDWLSAKMLFDQGTNTVTVLANWKSISSYQAFSSSSEFRSTMQQFGVFFAGKPEITTHEVLVEMDQQSI